MELGGHVKGYGWWRVRNADLAARGVASTETAGGVPAYYVGIRERDPPHHRVICALYDKPPTPTEGGGGWEEIAMPRRSATLVWKGRGLLKQSFDVVFDSSFTGAASVIDNPFLTLIHFWRPEPKVVEPPVLKLDSPGKVIPYQNLSWILSNLEWGDGEANDEGDRIEQILSLTFTEYRADERLKPGDPKQHTILYHMRDGHNLSWVAGHYKVKGGWKALGQMQHPKINDPRYYHKGRALTVPVK